MVQKIASVCYVIIILEFIIKIVMKYIKLTNKNKSG